MERIYKHPWIITIVMAAITVFFVAQLPKVTLDNNNMRFLPDENQARITAEFIDSEFGGQVVILIGLERPYSTVFDKGFLQQIREFSQAVERVELVKSINSIMSTQYITGDSESIIVSDLVPADFSGTQEEIAELRHRIASWDLFRGSLVSDDLSATQILITLDTLSVDAASPEVTRAFNKIRDLAGEIFNKKANVYFAGMTVLNVVINESIIADNLLLMPIALILLLGLLFFSFKRLIFVVLPLLTAIIAVVWTLGLTGLVGMKLSTITTIMPIILIAVGHAYGIHIITHYVKDTREKTLTHEEHQMVVIELIKKMFKPVFLAALTTVTGFISFCFTPIVPMREFGYCTSAGVLTVFILTMFFVPAMLLLRGPRDSQYLHELQNSNDRFSNIITKFFLGIAKQRKFVFISAILILGISLYGISKIVVDNSVVDFFQHETDVSRSDRFIREYFGGSKELNVVILADTTEELLHPDVLSAVDSLSNYLTEKVPAVGKVVGFTDVIKRINQVFNVDQSPEGLQPVASYAQTDSFGFGDFGFGGFGFGDFGFGDFGSYDDDYIETPRQQNSHNLEQYSAADLLRFFDSATGISSNLSGGDLVRELKRLTNYDGMAYYEVPANPARYGKEAPEELQQLVSNYLVLLAGDIDSGYSNDPLEPTAIRMMIQLRTTGSKDTQDVIDIINEFISVNFPENVDIMIGGGVTQEIAITDLILNSQIISIFISVLMIFLIVAISQKSLIAGVISAVPLILAVLFNFTVMAIFGIKLNLGTALIASLTVCIGIDDAIHFIEFYKREFKSGGQDPLRRTYIACGKAICITALSVGAGFAVLAFSRFKIIAEFGMLTAICMVSTTLVSLTIIPALLSTIKPKFIYGDKK
ncbi:MAG: MMPL family transporter [Treponema sp.]|nr:MMPL family transporter [Treponema sp.]